MGITYIAYSVFFEDDPRGGRDVYGDAVMVEEGTAQIICDRCGRLPMFGNPSADAHAATHRIQDKQERDEDQ